MKQRLTRRDFLSATAGVIAATVVAACGPASPAPAPQPESTKAPAVTAGQPTEPPAAIGSEAAEIDFVNWWGAGREPLMNEVISRFQNKHPHIKVNNIVNPWDNRAQAAATAMASKNPPHVLMAHREETYKYAADGLIINIDPYVEARGLDVDEIFYAAEINNQRYQGKLWTLPMPTGGGYFGQYFYNKDLLEAAGVDQAPKTWDDLYAAVNATTKKTDQGIEQLGANCAQTNLFVMWLYSNNGNYYSDDARQVTFNSPEGVEALEYMVSFVTDIFGRIEDHDSFMKGADTTSVDHPFYAGKLPIFFFNNALTGNMRITVPELFESDTWGVALTPYNANNPQATHRSPAGLAASWGYVIPKGLPKNLEEAAYLWVEYLCADEEAGCWFLDELARPSPVRKCNESPDKVKINPNLPTILEAMTIDVSVPITPVHVQIHAVLNDAVNEARFGRSKAKDALDKAAADGQPILDKYWSDLT